MDDVHVESLDNARFMFSSSSLSSRSPSPPSPQLFASLTSPLPLIPVLPALHRGDVIEIQGPASSGKTHLLYHILLSILVPPHPEIAAVVYDTDAAFDIQRFRHLLLSRISRLSSSTLDPHQTVRRALARLHLFRPTSLIQLAASIANLPAYHSSHMPSQEIAVLAIDSISTFYWADRFSAEQLRSAGMSVPLAPSFHPVLDALKTVQHSHRPLVILTDWALSSAPSCSESLYKQHLHPFPAIEDAIADLGAKASHNTDHSSLSPLRLAHLIALSSPSSDPFAAAPLDTILLRNPRHREGFVNEQLQCFIRSFGTPQFVRCTFEVTHDDILVYPNPMSCLSE